MDQFDGKSLPEAWDEMRELRKTVNPLATILLVADYSHPELEKAISKINRNTIKRIRIRLSIILLLLQNQKNNFYRPKDYTSSSIQNLYKETYCDFKEVMKILGRSKGTVESLITNKDIKVIQNKTGEKRSFIRAEIIKYAQGLH